MFKAVTSPLSPSLSEGDGRKGGGCEPDTHSFAQKIPSNPLVSGSACSWMQRNNCTYTLHPHTNVGTDVSRDSKWSGGRFFHPGEWGGG